MPGSTAYAIGELLSANRASKRTVFDAAGNLVELANDSFGLTYDPVTLAPLGLLQENGGTNYIRNPRAEGATVGDLGAGGVAPTNHLLQGSATPNTRTIVGSGVESGITYYDVRIRSPGVTAGNALEIVWETPTVCPAAAGEFVTASVFLSLLSGAVPTGTNQPALSVSEYDAAGTYKRINNAYITIPTGPLARNRISRSFTMLLAETAFARPLLRIHPGMGEAFDFTLRIGAPQLERETYPSSPILPPVGAPAIAARVADSVRLDLTKIGFANMGSTILWRGVIRDPVSEFGSARSRGIWRFDDGTDNNFIAAAVNSGGGITIRWAIDGVGAAYTIGNLVLGQEFSLAATWGPGFVAASLNGTAAVVGSMTGYPIGLSGGRVGAWGSWGNNALHGTTRQFDIIPRTVSAAELPTVSA